MSRNLHEKYKSYSLEELLQDDEFIASSILSTEESKESEEQTIQEDVELNNDDVCFAVYFIKSIHVKSEPIHADEVQALWNNIQLHATSQISRKRFVLYFAIASGMAALLALILTIRFEQDTNYLQPYVLNPQYRDSKSIQLILSKTETLNLEGQEIQIAYSAPNLSVNNQSIATKAKVSQKDMHQLIVPFGKRAKVQLSEGTEIWVNSGSHIIYPLSFGKNKREILVCGEVCLNVVSDEQRPFIVHSKYMDVEVLGTYFNVRTDEDDSVQNIVLISGSVKIKSKYRVEEIILKPNEMFVSVNGVPSVKEVDALQYVAWTSGIYQYSSETLEVIFQNLSRYYGINIEYSSGVANLRCSGKLDLKNDPQPVLSAIAQTAPISVHHDATSNKYKIMNLTKDLPMK
jgi:hypothetical protein